MSRLHPYLSFKFPAAWASERRRSAARAGRTSDRCDVTSYCTAVLKPAPPSGAATKVITVIFEALSQPWSWLHWAAKGQIELWSSCQYLLASINSSKYSESEDHDSEPESITVKVAALSALLAEQCQCHVVSGSGRPWSRRVPACGGPLARRGAIQCKDKIYGRFCRGQQGCRSNSEALKRVLFSRARDQKWLVQPSGKKDMGLGLGVSKQKIKSQH